LALDGRGADRERKLNLIDDPVEEQVPLRRLELLGVLLGLGQSLELLAVLLAHRADDGFEALLLEEHVEARAHLHLADDVLLGGLHRERRGEVSRDLLDRAAGLPETLGADALADAVGLTGDLA